MAFEYFDRDDEGNLTEMVNAIRGISFNAAPGDLVVVAGRNGSGKSTFARILNRLLVPIEGRTEIFGMDASEEENKYRIRSKVGMVFQNPDDQFVGSIVEEEVAFGAENLSMPEGKLKMRVEQALKDVGLAPAEFGGRRLEELSGGEKQKVAVAGILAMGTECVVLDEATSMLDPVSERELMAVLKRLALESRLIVILITHNMEELTSADYIYVMDRGRIVLKGKKSSVLADGASLKKYGLSLPKTCELASGIKSAGLIRTDALYDIHSLADRIMKEHMYVFKGDGTFPPVKRTKRKIRPVNAVIMNEASCSYGKKQVITDVSCAVAKGEYVAVVGGTGAGKSTLLKMMMGLKAAKPGMVYVDGLDVNDKGTDMKLLNRKMGYLFQFPEHQLFLRNVYEDVLFGPMNLGVSEVEAQKRAYECIELVGLPQDVYDLPMYKLSGGMKKRAALAGVLAMEPEYLILDEPTAGLDPEGAAEFMALIDALHKDAGITIIMAAHDMELVAAYADTVIVLNEGRVIYEGVPAEVFLEAALEGDDRLPAIPKAQELMIELRKKGLNVNPYITDADEAIREIERFCR